MQIVFKKRLFLICMLVFDNQFDLIFLINPLIHQNYWLLSIWYFFTFICNTGIFFYSQLHVVVIQLLLNLMELKGQR